MKKIISFSLWGNNTKYTIGAIKNVILRDEFYPGWICRFYVDNTVPKDIVEVLEKSKGTEVITITEEHSPTVKKWSGMFWRFLAAERDFNETENPIVIFRDCDSRFTLRESTMVNLWMHSKKEFHIIRDHPQHSTEVMGGMWGVKNGKLDDIRQRIKDYYRRLETGESKDLGYGIDQNFLKEIYPSLIKDNALVNDEFFEKTPPIKELLRTDKDFIGKQYEAWE